MTCAAKAENIKACVFDVDGTLTDGRIGYGCGAKDAIKFFYCQDGLGIFLLHRAGLKFCILTGREDFANSRRALDLKCDVLEDGCSSKDEGLRRICEKLGITPEECLYMGDDLNDLPAMEIAGLTAAPADAVEYIRNRVHWVSQAKAGRGAVREIIDRLLKEAGKLDDVIAHYRGGSN